MEKTEATQTQLKFNETLDNLLKYNNIVKDDEYTKLYQSLESVVQLRQNKTSENNGYYINIPGNIKNKFKLDITDLIPIKNKEYLSISMIVKPKITKAIIVLLNVIYNQIIKGKTADTILNQRGINIIEGITSIKCDLECYFKECN